jgi:site-specific DNA-adenine methylase
MRYGVGYKGSKSRIARDIIGVLPPGSRLIDLFGGGGAISHCAFESGKWSEIIYSDNEPSIVSLVKGLFNGDFRSKSALYAWVSRERFYAEKDNDPIIRWVWSFSNNGKDYLYGANIEPQKEAIHRAIVDKVYSKTFLDITGGTVPFYHHSITDRKKDWLRFCRLVLHSVDFNRVPHLERLTIIQSVINLEQITGACGGLSGIECLCRDYKSYEYCEGDIVYCDPPYAKTKCDSYSGFNNKAFWDWARTIPCYVSEYHAPQGFTQIWEKAVPVLSTSDGNSRKTIERLFKSPACK